MTPALSSRYLLAVEGGGSKTTALLTDLDGKAAGRGFGSGSNPHAVGIESAHKAITMAIDGALINATGRLPEGGSWQRTGIAAAALGLAGIDGPEDEAQLAAWVKQQELAERFVVVNDSELVLAAGTPEGWGVALISGAGSVCLARSPQGRTIRVGGWGHLLGDEGSGYRLALEALRLATQTVDGRADADALLHAILRHWSLPDAGALIRHVHAPGMTPADIAALAPAIVTLAASGDAAARALVDASVKDLARQVDTAIRRLALDKPPLALAGSQLRGDIRRGVLTTITSPLGDVAYVDDPCRGAVTLAKRLLRQAGGPGGAA
jgi:N-acetylglucosamine kinase-like BadF-type ATPase